MVRLPAKKGKSSSTLAIGATGWVQQLVPMVGSSSFQDGFRTSSHMSLKIQVAGKNATGQKQSRECLLVVFVTKRDNKCQSWALLLKRRSKLTSSDL